MMRGMCEHMLRDPKATSKGPGNRNHGESHVSTVNQEEPWAAGINVSGMQEDLSGLC